jgi:hypothetical protein
LAVFVSSAKENDQALPIFPAINAISGANVDAQFGDAFAHRLAIAEIS